MAALDLFGRRWALRLIWELRQGAVGARELRKRCDDMSSSVLYHRLSELTEAKLIEQDVRGDYRLSDLGADLASALVPLIDWSQAWAAAQDTA